MKITRHGLTIGIERIENRFFLSLKVIGKLTHQDYQMITPMLDSAIEGINQPILDIYIDASELEGWELRAAWDDFKLGLKHGKEIKKIAIFANKKWQSFAIKAGSWFISGDIKYFEDETTALEWINTE